MYERKYWILTTEYPPDYGGGIGTYVYNTAKMLGSNCWDVTIFLYNNSLRKDRVSVTNKIRLIEFTSFRTKEAKALGFETARSYDFATVLLDYMKAEGIPDILESQEYGAVPYYVLQFKHLNYAYFKDLKTLLTLHAPSFLYNVYNRVPSYELPYYWIGEMEKWCIVAADLLTAPSQFIVEQIKKNLPQHHLLNVHIVPLPYEKNIQKQDSSGNKFEDLLFFGKLTPQKGILPLLRAFDHLWQNKFSKSLTVIGGDHFYHIEESYLENWINQKYKSRIKSGLLNIYGSLPPSKWEKILSQRSIVIIPSIGDNYPYTVLESMSRKNIVLSSTQGGQSELIEHGENGFLFDHLKPHDLSDKILEITAKATTDLENIAEAGRQATLQKHAYDVVYAKKLLALEALEHNQKNKSNYPFLRLLAIENEDGQLPKQNNTLTVVIPYFNMGNYVEDTLISIKKNKYLPIETIIVNDGSTDEHSIQKLQQLKEIYEFKLIEINNSGLANARNKGAEIAEGKYLTFLDPDDKIEPEYYQRAIDILENKKNVSFVGCWAQYFEGAKKIWPAFTPEPPYILYHNMINSSALIYKRDSFIKYGLNDSTLEYGLEDWESVISLLRNGHAGVAMPQPFWNYRVRKASMFRRITEAKMLYSVDYISQKHNAFYKNYGTEIVGLLQANGPGSSIDNPSLIYKRGGSLKVNSPFFRKLIVGLNKMPLLKKQLYRLYKLIK